VCELRAIMREGKSQIDPNVKRELKIAAMVKDAWTRGYTEEQVQALIDSCSTSLPPAKKKGRFVDSEVIPVNVADYGVHESAR
jgi:hypothetical protein